LQLLCHSLRNEFLCVGIMHRKFGYILFLIATCFVSYGQCKFDMPVSSARIANYTMDVTLDHVKHIAKTKARLQWINPSPDTISKIRMYMYLNAFKNEKSAWISGTGGNVFGQDLASKPKEEWGYVNIDKIVQGQSDITKSLKYIQPHIDNKNDQSVIEMTLANPVMPEDTLYLDYDFTAKLPKTIARSGHGLNDFHLWVHWYPKIGVYEQFRDGDWKWNCREFIQRTEFYGEFGVYDMTFHVSDHLTLGSSGCKIDRVDHEDDTYTVQYVAKDVIDFAWTVSPEFEIVEQYWKDVYIKLLLPVDHKGMKKRYMAAVTNALEYFEKHVAKYPYPSITIVDPPFHSLRNGFMEYPTLITVGGFTEMPNWFHGSESLLIHEFSHQYFMGILASNEKEEAWLDEGFVTYYEDRIMEAYYGAHTSQIDVLGFHYGNSALSRNEYVGMRNIRGGPINQPSWQINGDYKGLVYAKTATMLKTLERYIGIDRMDDLMQTYYEEKKFTHPRAEDFLGIVESKLSSWYDRETTTMYMQFLDRCLNQTGTFDYAVNEVNANSFVVSQLGDYDMPVDIQVVFKDNSEEMIQWSGQGKNIAFKPLSDKEIVSVYIDPEQKLIIDSNCNNNSFTRQPNKSALFKYAGKLIHWTQQIFQTTSFLL